MQKLFFDSPLNTKPAGHCKTSEICYAPFQQKHELCLEELLLRQHAAGENSEGTLLCLVSTTV